MLPSCPGRLWGLPGGGDHTWGRRGRPTAHPPPSMPPHPISLASLRSHAYPGVTGRVLGQSGFAESYGSHPPKLGRVRASTRHQTLVGGACPRKCPAHLCTPVSVSEAAARDGCTWAALNNRHLFLHSLGPEARRQRGLISPDLRGHRSSPPPHGAPLRLGGHRAPLSGVPL